jgi:beta-glucosidase
MAGEYRERARTIVARLSLDEKIGLLSGADMWHTRALPGQGLPAAMLTDGPHGLRKELGGGQGAGIFASEPATCFPPAVTLGSTWDPALAEEVGAAIGAEARAQGVAVVLGPGLNLKRHPCCGRTFEYYAEDPLLSGHVAAAFVRGVQSTGTGACLKHFAVNNQESNRMVHDVLVDERTLRELYLTGFEIAVKQSAPRAVMAAYNRVNGTYCAEHERLLTRILRDEWDFEGLVMSDWGATNDRVLALGAGLDLEMPSSGGAFDEALREAVADGILPAEMIDAAAARVVELAVATALADGDGGFDAEAHHALARRVAAEGTVLLANHGTLPLEPRGRIAVIGALAEHPRYQGTGSSRVVPTRLENALESIRAHVGDTGEVVYAPGYDAITGDADEELILDAVIAAETSEVVVLVLGLPGIYESEGFDRTHLRLPEAHDRLVTAVCDANPRTVVVLMNGAPVEMPWAERPAAILEAYLGGQAGGQAVADVLFGDAEPGGRLAETFPLAQADLPADANFPGKPRQVQYREGLRVGYRAFEPAGAPVRFCFGHGLSYTRFEVGEPVLSSVRIKAGEQLEVRVPVSNTGSRPGSTVVQVYVRALEPRVWRPALALAGFAKVRLAPGDSTQVHITLAERAFSFYDVATAAWQVEGGEYEVCVGLSVTDIRGTARVWVESEFEPDPVPAPARRVATDAEFSAMLGRPIPRPEPLLPFTRTSTVADLGQTWLGRRVRRVLVTAARREARRMAAGDPATALLVERAALETPLRSLVTMGGGRLSWRGLDRLIGVLNAAGGSRARR